MRLRWHNRPLKPRHTVHRGGNSSEQGPPPSTCLTGKSQGPPPCNRPRPRRHRYRQPQSARCPLRRIGPSYPVAHVSRMKHAQHIAQPLALLPASWRRVTRLRVRLGIWASPSRLLGDHLPRRAAGASGQPAQAELHHRRVVPGHSPPRHLGTSPWPQHPRSSLPLTTSSQDCLHSNRSRFARGITRRGRLQRSPSGLLCSRVCFQASRRVPTAVLHADDFLRQAHTTFTRRRAVILHGGTV